jgi:hypothetical protein
MGRGSERNPLYWSDFGIGVAPGVTILFAHASNGAYGTKVEVLVVCVRERS